MKGRGRRIFCVRIFQKPHGAAAACMENCATRIVEFHARVIANFRKELLIEEGSVGGKLRLFGAVAKALRLIGDGEGHDHRFAARSALAVAR